MIDDHDLPEDSDDDSDYKPSEESDDALDDALEYNSEAEDCCVGTGEEVEVEE